MTKEEILKLIDSSKIMDIHDARLQEIYYVRDAYDKALEDLRKKISGDMGAA